MTTTKDSILTDATNNTNLEDEHLSFFNLLEKVAEYGAIKSPDFVAITLPLIEAVSALHQHNQVAFITGVNDLRYNDSFLLLNGEARESLKNPELLFKKPAKQSVIEVSESISQVTDLDANTIKHSSLDIKKGNEEISKPLYITAYKVWDYEREHYDPLTDVFQLGQFLASLAYNLDFNKANDLESFVRNRKSLYFLNKDLHPSLHSIIHEMTQLFREDRTKNLDEIINKLKTYRDYNPENYVDLTDTEGFRNQDVSERSHWILAKLKNRLFDISRRNKLLYFSEQARFLNLTIGSVPLLLDHENIKEDGLLFWNESIQAKIVKQNRISLNSFMEFKDNPFLASNLNKIRLEARKSENEYGFSQLRIVVAFLHWYNVKESEEERITSPLLLLPVEIIKKKGVEDQYLFEFKTTEAEINPILSHVLKDLYGIELPDFIDLETNNIDELIQSIKYQIKESGSGIQLEWREKPRIKLIHAIAKKDFNLRNKKLLNRGSSLTIKSFKYSYDQTDFQPLGLKIFQDLVSSNGSSLEYIINDDLHVSQAQAVADKSRTFYQTDNEGDVNPLMWEVDTCNLTIGNFNYRKMSLVRDYNELIDSGIKNNVFEQLFDELPKALTIEHEKIALRDNFPIISSDPTQTSAIELARTGKSYIIQGPPGTGKSQTITNLVADYISRDKKVLFVCEKRAALDVVFHRLKNKNLDELCCLVHDSQMDKKSFIQDLKNVYNDFQKNPLNTDHIEKQRDLIVSKIDKELKQLGDFHELMRTGVNATKQISPIELFAVLNTHGKNKTAQLRDRPSKLECIKLPSYQDWQANESWVQEWFNQLANHDFPALIKDYPFAQLSDTVLAHETPKVKVLECIDSCINHLDEFIEFIDNVSSDDGIDKNNTEEKTLSEWIEEFSLAEKVIGLSQVDKLSVLDENSDDAKALKQQQEQIFKAKKSLEGFQTDNKHWKNKFDLRDTQSAIEHWNSHQSSILRFLKPSYYRLKKKIKISYDFSAHEIMPNISSVLAKLLAENDMKKTVDKLEQKLMSDFNLNDIDDDCEWIESIQSKPNKLINEWLNEESNSQRYLQALIEQKDNLSQLITNSTILFKTYEQYSVTSLEVKLNQCKKSLPSLSVFLPFVMQAQQQTQLFQDCLLNKSWDLSDFAYHCAYKSLNDIYELDRPFSETNGDSLQHCIDRVNALLDQYYNSNVEAIRTRTRDKFSNLLRITESSAAQLTEDEKVLKKSYRSGRKILENEFGKSMRYKSIRELTSGDARDVITTIKPVWLMSPLSVSDVLPIDTSIFDVVIYDEASQITLEEGVPSLFRTLQTIVVGDEMQMPPTNFFSASTVQDEDEEETEEKAGISLDAESLLNQSSRKLASVMLGWHYRSRHESLISFSNAAFYQRGLLTIPDTVTTDYTAEALVPVANVSVDVNVDDILNRSISFHYLENAVYENRKNKDEADYIANIVRQILKSDSNKSIGVVAFSMGQQGQIESALESMAEEDPIFSALLDAEYQREDDDQFNGIFVKNLENVQGDERDIIIMSVCYGSNAKGRLLMNFGPINRRGGEKRLNVIFSRAKENMVVISSILPNEIKNDYNEGANYFKRFLSYAKHCSDGKDVEANLILDSMHAYDEDVQGAQHIVAHELSQVFEEKGYLIDYAVGKSHFKCDLAIKEEHSKYYKLGIIIDKPSYYAKDNILEQYCQKPSLLKAFGWTVVTVYSKDWFENKERTLEKIDQAIQGEISVAELAPDELKMREACVESNDASHKKLSSVMLDKHDVSDIKDENQTPEEFIKRPKTELKKDNTVKFERYEFKSEVSQKFWQIAVKENTVYVQYGRIGKALRENEKSYESPEKAILEKNKLITIKVRKGYEIQS